MSTWRFIRYWLYVGHRWLGIAACLLFTLWFVSGLVMSYVGYPALDEPRRIEALRPIDWDLVSVEASELLSSLPLSHYPRELRLEMLLDEPVYRIIDWDGSRRTVSAVQIRSIGSIGPEQAAAIAEQYAGSPARSQSLVQRDQWTVPERFARVRPLHKIRTGDVATTEVYVSAVTGQVVLATTRVQRFWNWLGSVPHWIYFTELRANQPLWRQVNLWVSGPAILIAISGIWIGILRLRVRRPYPHGALSPYHGWMLWHHWAGILGGVFLLAWILSGWLSVNPNQWLSGGGGPSRDSLLAYAGEPGLRFEARWQSLDRTLLAGSKQVSFLHFDGQALVLVIGADSTRVLLDAASGRQASISDERIFEAARRLMPASTMIGWQRLKSEDAYWYSHHDQRALPVLRVDFDDAENSSIYLDPTAGAVVEFVDDGARRYRWWFNALHRLDFRWLRQSKTLWHATIWTLCIAGLLTSLSAVVIGWKRLRRTAVVTSGRKPGAPSAGSSGLGMKSVREEH